MFDDGLDRDRDRHRDRTEQTPPAAETTDERCRGRGGPLVDGEEGARVARHPPMLPAPPHTDAVSEYALRVPGDLFVKLLEPGDQLLDPVIVG